MKRCAVGRNGRVRADSTEANGAVSRFPLRRLRSARSKILHRTGSLISSHIASDRSFYLMWCLGNGELHELNYCDRSLSFNDALSLSGDTDVVYTTASENKR